MSFTYNCEHCGFELDFQETVVLEEYGTSVCTMCSYDEESDVRELVGAGAGYDYGF